MDDLLAMMDGSSDPEDEINDMHSIHDDTELKTSSGMNQTYRQSQKSGQTHLDNTTKSSSSSTGCIDPLTKIRIVQRQTSKVDLVDLLAPFQFHTSAVLANMPKTQLSTLITHPSNKDNGGGRTDTATMGIIFNNSGTRMSKSGRAFSILTLGDLHTGPTISIFLFGHVYSSFTTKIKPGHVVAIVGGSIMPPKDNYGGETRISMSVNDVHQIIMVGKAMDFGICAAMTVDRRHGMNQNGHNQVRCKKFVDLRICRFCNFHAKQQNKNANVGSSNHNSQGQRSNKTTRPSKNMTFIQNLRSENGMRQRGNASFNMERGSNNQLPPNVMTMVMPGQGAVVTHNPNHNPNARRSGLGRSNALDEAMSSWEADTSNHTGPNPSQSRSLQRAPKHLKLSNAPATNLAAMRDSSEKKNVRNPYAKRSAVTVSTKDSNNHNDRAKSSQNNSSNQDVLGHALSGRRSMSHTPITKRKDSQATKNVRKRNLVHMEGMNGAVQVPKPNALFRRSTPNPYKSAPCTYASEPVTPSPQQKSMLIERQRQLAERLKSTSNKTQPPYGNKTNATKDHSNKSGMCSSNSNLNDMLGTTPLSDATRASILGAKSKYSQEAKAENYAKSRQAVSELEKQEMAYNKKQERKNRNSNSKQGVGNSGTKSSVGSAIIVSEYKCVTCNRITQTKPTKCIASNHKVKRKREIKKNENASQKRMNITKSSMQDGGLVLGAGLEWSGWRHQT